MPAVILIVMGIGLGLISDVFSKVPHSKRTKGEIVSLESRKIHDEGKMAYTAYVEYYVKGKTYTVKSRFRSSSFHVGDQINVDYNERNPAQAIVRSKAITYVVMMGFIIAGVIVWFCI